MNQSITQNNTRAKLLKIEKSHNKLQNILSEYFCDPKLTDQLFKLDDSEDDGVLSFLNLNKTTYQSSK